MMQRRACAQATKALIQLGKKISMEKDCINIFANTFSNETANAFYKYVWAFSTLFASL